MKVSDIATNNNLDSYRTPAEGNKPQRNAKSDISMLAEIGVPRSQYTPDELDQAIDKINNTMEAYYTNLSFEKHEESGEIMVKVINRDDGTVIREIPPEQILNMVAYFKELLGIVVDKFI